jgi:protein-S-isoprenylcysteine O-methyltransferase Ste14
MTVISRIAGMLLIAAIVVLIATGSFFSPSPLVIACQLGAVALAAWARRTFAPGQFGVTSAPRGESLIRRGPYRFMRHPMYSASMLLLWATVLSHWSGLNLAVGAIPTLALILRILDEERRLRERYPDYADYARATKALVPFVV